MQFRASEEDVAAMRRCIELARSAAEEGEVPVGALVRVGKVTIAEGQNRCESTRNALAHAEMEALNGAFASIGEGRMPLATLYCTLEPCFMCAGAALHARVQRIVFAARDPKFGACASLANLGRDQRLNHRCVVDEGLFYDEVAQMMRTFFKGLR